MNKYKFYQTMHPDGRVHGGTAVLIRNNIKHVIIRDVILLEKNTSKRPILW